MAASCVPFADIVTSTHGRPEAAAGDDQLVPEFVDALIAPLDVIVILPLSVYVPAISRVPSDEPAIDVAEEDGPVAVDHDAPLFVDTYAVDELRTSA
jgi:hypothetical protein